MKKTVTAITAGVLAAMCSSAIAAQPYVPKDAIADSIIIRMKDMDAHQRGTSSVQKRLAPSAGKKLMSNKTLQVREQLNRSFWVVDISGKPTDSEILKIIDELEKGDYGVLSAEPNYYVYPMNATFNDPGWESFQKPRYDFTSSVGYNSGISKFLTDNQTAGQNQTVAIVDTGRINHLDVSPTISNEVNFSPLATNQTKGDATAGLGHGCTLNSSSPITHGLRMSSLAVATRNNQRGMVGTSAAKSYAVRALSECDGSGETADVIKGILWSAGLDMDEGQNFAGNGYPRNDTPATVINLSLGSTPLPNEANCQTGSAMQTAVLRAIAAGSTVVASAGNDYNLIYVSAPFEGQRVGQRLSGFASCEGVVSVGALDFNGQHARYSNIPRQGERLVTSVAVGNGTSNSDSTYEAALDNSYGFGIGTSQAAAIVSGLLASVIDLLGPNRPTNEELLSAIASSGSPFPETDPVCAPSIRDCGTRLDMAKLTAALGLNQPPVEPEPEVFARIFSPSEFNLTDIATVISFTNAQGNNEPGASTRLSSDFRTLEVQFNQGIVGKFFLKVGSSAFVQNNNSSETALIEITVGQAGDIAATLFATARTEFNANQVFPGAVAILDVLDFQLKSGVFNQFPGETPFQIVNGRLVFNFNTATNAVFELLIELNDGAPSQVGAQAVRREAVTMTVVNGQPTQFAQAGAPVVDNSGNNGAGAVAGGGGGGGGSMTLFGLLALTLLLIAQKYSLISANKKARIKA